MRVLVLNVQVPFVRGGAEFLAERLRAELAARGHEAEVVTLPFKWYPAQRLLDAALAWRLTDLSQSNGSPIDRVIALKFPTYVVEHDSKVIWLCHQHRSAYDLWGTPFGDLEHQPGGVTVRNLLHEIDRRFIPQASSVLTISERVAARLEESCGIAGSPLYHPPPDAAVLGPGPAGDYLFFPSRLSPIKRQELVIDALALSRSQARVHFAGSPDNPSYALALRARAEHAGVDHRIAWLGRLSPVAQQDAYRHARGVIFPPWDEDYGYVTLEAMIAAKPVLTCTDSGGPLEFVVHGRTGLVAEPTPEAVAAALDELWGAPARAAAMGDAGRDRYLALDISWDNAIDRLLA